MLDDPRFQKIVRFMFWGGLLVIVTIAAMVIFSRFERIKDSAQPEGDPVELEEREDGRLVVPAGDVPVSFEERLRAPALSLLPSRVEGVASVPAPPAERQKIIRAADRFLLQWNRFLPGDNLYSLRLSKMVKPSSLSGVAGRDDVVESIEICPDGSCELGLEPVASPDLRIADFNGQRAYVIGYGVVEVLAPGQTGDLFNQSYGIILQDTKRGWLVERAAGEILGRIS